MLSPVLRRNGPGRGEEEDATALLKSFEDHPLEYGGGLCFLSSKSGSQKGPFLAQKKTECRGGELLGQVFRQMMLAQSWLHRIFCLTWDK